MKRYSLHFGKFGAYFLDKALEEPMYLEDVLEELNNPLQWSHIRTAPKDGTWILLAGPSSYNETTTRTAICSYTEDYWITSEGEHFDYGNQSPTKWAYIPED